MVFVHCYQACTCLNSKLLLTLPVHGSTSFPFRTVLTDQWEHIPPPFFCKCPQSIQSTLDTSVTKTVSAVTKQKSLKIKQKKQSLKEALEGWVFLFTYLILKLPALVCLRTALTRDLFTMLEIILFHPGDYWENDLKIMEKIVKFKVRQQEKAKWMIYAKLRGHIPPHALTIPSHVSVWSY